MPTWQRSAKIVVGPTRQSHNSPFPLSLLSAPSSSPSSPTRGRGCGGARQGGSLTRGRSPSPPVPPSPPPMAPYRGRLCCIASSRRWRPPLARSHRGAQRGRRPPSAQPERRSRALLRVRPPPRRASLSTASRCTGGGAEHRRESDLRLTALHRPPRAGAPPPLPPGGFAARKERVVGDEGDGGADRREGRLTGERGLRHP
ncbi:hypothetical protein DAI22_12g056100 [Oryza sativa Japonica Group]|nr:hypothetical protein DAI22_12g056100 [Oryza sativa Japonica Group]